MGVARREAGAARPDDLAIRCRVRRSGAAPGTEEACGRLVDEHLERAAARAAPAMTRDRDDVVGRANALVQPATMQAAGDSGVRIETEFLREVLGAEDRRQRRISGLVGGHQPQVGASPHVEHNAPGGRGRYTRIYTCLIAACLEFHAAQKPLLTRARAPYARIPTARRRGIPHG